MHAFAATRRIILCLGLSGIQGVGMADDLVSAGQSTFQRRCVVCHGVNADGRSNLARIMQPPPANLRASKLSDAQQAAIVRLGGAAVNRSPNMPEWRQELSEEELQAVLAYVRTIRGTEP